MLDGLERVSKELTLYDSPISVTPAHSFKYASELQFVVGKKGTTPLLLHVEPGAGHGGASFPASCQ